MKYIPQQTYYDCSVASIAMALSHFVKGKFLRKWKVCRSMYSKNINIILDLDGKQNNRLYINMYK